MGMGGGGVIVSNPTAVKVELSCIEVVVGVLTTDETEYQVVDLTE